MSWWRKSWPIVIVISNGGVHWRILNHQIIDRVHVLSYHLLCTLFRLWRRSVSTSDTTLPRMSWFGRIYFLRPMCWINGPTRSWSSLLKVSWTQHPIEMFDFEIWRWLRSWWLISWTDVHLLFDSLVIWWRSETLRGRLTSSILLYYSIALYFIIWHSSFIDKFVKILAALFGTIGVLLLPIVYHINTLLCFELCIIFHISFLFVL